MDRALVLPADDIDAASPTVAGLIAGGVVDAELAALLWLLLDGHVPLVVAGRGDARERQRVLGALLDLLPAGVRRHPADDGATDGADARTSYLVLDELLPDGPSAADARRARAAVRSLQRGFGLATTLAADSLEDVFAFLGAPPLGLQDDAIRQLGVVLILRGTPERVVAAHYLRPVERDGHGHLQRRPPAVLATSDAKSGDFEHFAWGVTPELAIRVGRLQADFEQRQAGRMRFLEALAADQPPALDLIQLFQDFRVGEDRGQASSAARPHRAPPHTH